MFKNKTLNRILQIYYNCNNFRKVCWYHHSIKETLVKNFALVTTVNQELFSQIILLTAPITYLPRQAFRWIFNFFLCHVPPDSKCLFHLWEPTLTFLSFTGHILQVRFLVFPLFEELWPPALWQSPPDPTSLPILIQDHTWIMLPKFTWVAAKSFSLNLNWAEK